MACNGVGTPRLLLNSVSGRFPNGLANSSGLVGKNLMFHPYAQVFGYVEEPLDSNRAPPLCLWSMEFYETDPSRDFVRGYAFQFGRGIGPVTEAIFSDADGRLPWGEDHHRVFRKLVGRRIGLSAICEDLPEEHNRVTLDPVLKDGHGIPAPKVDYTLSENSLRMMDHGIARAKEVLAAAGATNVGVQSPILNGGWHLLGTARMGDGPGTVGGERMGPLPRREEPVHRRWQHLRHLRRREPDLHHPGAGAVYRRQHEAASGDPVRLRQTWKTTADGLSAGGAARPALRRRDDGPGEHGIRRARRRRCDDLRRHREVAGPRPARCAASAGALSPLAGGAFADLDVARREVAARVPGARRGGGGGARAGRSCNATIATTAWCARSGWSRGRRSRRDTRWNRETGRCSTRCARGRRCGVMRPDARAPPARLDAAGQWGSGFGAPLTTTPVTPLRCADQAELRQCGHAVVQTDPPPRCCHFQSEARSCR